MDLVPERGLAGGRTSVLLSEPGGPAVQRARDAGYPAVTGHRHTNLGPLPPFTWRRRWGQQQLAGFVLRSGGGVYTLRRWSDDVDVIHRQGLQQRAATIGQHFVDSFLTRLQLIVVAASVNNIRIVSRRWRNESAQLAVTACGGRRRDFVNTEGQQ